jgi:formate C-acetyltransferase
MMVASGIKRVLDSFSPVIIPDEIIVGFNFADKSNRGNADCNDRWPKDTKADRNKMRENGISNADIEVFFACDNNTKVDCLNYQGDAISQQARNLAFESAAGGGFINSNHTVIGYEKVLKKGFFGLLDEINEAEAKNGTNEVYQSMKAVCLSAASIGEKYAQKAKELLSDANYRKEDLEKIISVCSRVPKYPAESFVEAVQALWFAHIINTWEDFINANSLGRLGQMLYPYYKADIEKGLITKEEAFEIICLLWLKLYRDYDVQQSCVGGTDIFGKSRVNELSYLMLDATEQLGFVRCLSVRFSPKTTEREFIKRALEVTGHLQNGVPFFFNDDVLVPALTSKGISFEDACDYTQLGCVETVIPGKSNPHAVTGNVNLLKTVEYVLCNGFSMLYPEFENGIKTGKLETFNTFERFYDAVLVQAEHLIKTTCDTVSKLRPLATKALPKPYKSLLTEGCIESGKDFNDEGAKYDYYQIMLSGIPNLADSLAAIKHFVYDTRKYTLNELKTILENNFEDEMIRSEFLNRAPKYGNDIDEVDKLAADIMDKTCDMLDKMSEHFGLSFHAQPFTYLWMIDLGSNSAASPDGRRKGEPLAYSCSSMQGRDFNGLTSLFNSITKLPSKKAPGTVSAIVETDPKLFTSGNIDIMTTVLITAAEKGLANVQFNITDAQTLMDAQKNPDKHKNLAVRVSGFSQKFTQLDDALQDHIINRTKHNCM